MFGGILVIAIGLYFIVRKGIMRGFADDLRGVDEHGGDAVAHTILVAGVVGWVGRGAVTVLVGFFVLRAAIQFDPNDARGFDGALRKSPHRRPAPSWSGAAPSAWCCTARSASSATDRRHLEDNS